MRHKKYCGRQKRGPVPQSEGQRLSLKKESSLYLQHVGKLYRLRGALMKISRKRRLYFSSAIGETVLAILFKKNPIYICSMSYRLHAAYFRASIHFFFNNAAPPVVA
jgi:hypothetical protein